MWSLLTCFWQESYANPPSDVENESKEASYNLVALRRYANTTNILDHVLCHRERTFSSLLRTLQLVLTHLQLDITMSPATFSFEYSQKAVYGHPSKNRMFRNSSFEKINIEFLLDTVNFFKFHMTNPRAQTLYDLVNGLAERQKPKAWDSRVEHDLGEGQLGKHWLGTYGKISPKTIKSEEADPPSQLW